MKTDPREIWVYYNSETASHKMTIAHAKGITQHVKTFDFSNNPSTTTSWQMIIKSLGIEPKEMLNKAHPDYQKNLRGKEFDTNGWLNVLKNNTHLIKAPIAIRGNKAVMCSNPTDIYRL